MSDSDRVSLTIQQYADRHQVSRRKGRPRKGGIEERPWQIAVPVGEVEYFTEPECGLLPTAPEAEPSRTSGVYVVRGAGLVKIGRSSCVYKRFYSLRTESPVPLEPVGFIPCHPGSISHRLEKALHERFSGSHHHGEWFSETPDLAAFIATELQPWPPREWVRN